MIVQHVGGSRNEGTDTILSGVETLSFAGQEVSIDDIVSLLGQRSVVSGDDFFM